MRRKIAVYLEEQEYINLQRITNRENKTITAYCKEKIFEQPNKNLEKEDLLKNHILRQFENLLFLLISQKEIDTSKINQESLKTISSYAIHIGNLKAKNNKQLKFQRQIEFDYKNLFRLVNIKNINSLITQVNEEKQTNKKIFLLGSYIQKIKDSLKNQRISNEV